MTAELYHGSCQCGAVAYDVTVDISNPIACNCSRCQRLGSLFAFTPLENFKLLRGEDALSEYTFNKRRIRHMFCKTCGIESFAYGQMPDGTAVVAVNANCLEGVDPRALSFNVHDGRAA